MLCLVFLMKLILPDIFYMSGHTGSSRVEGATVVVASATYKREIAGSISDWAELCSDIVLLGKALCPCVHSQPRSK